jgi:hypothetical protein
MDRAEAVSLYKEISDVLEDLGSSAVNLVKSSANDPEATGYRIIIQSLFPNERADQIKTIAKKHGLVVNIEGDKVIIYKNKKSLTKVAE